ncbi:MAG: hypothetical protein AABX28_02065 [Nanoarchaeota archaeon]
MESIKILNKTEKQKIIEKLDYQFGIKEIPGLIVSMGKERLFLFSGNFDENQIKKLESVTSIERMGIYFAKFMTDNNGEKIKLSIEGTQILQKQIDKNLFEISEEQTEEWMKGHELQIKTGMKGFIVIKHDEDFLGSGKASEEKITNFIPKSRRLKEKS